MVHILTGTATGNILGPISLFLVIGSTLQLKARFGMDSDVIPLTTFGIQPRLDSFAFSVPNQYIYNIAGHFQGLYLIIIGGSLVFHLIYGALTGFISGRMVEIGILINVRNDMIVQP